jgi:hypothetical protein
MERARAIADAVLYEGMLLFPYRKSSLKNHLPFQFGVIMPQGYADPTEPSWMRCEFVLCGGESISGVLRFLHAAGEPRECEVPFAFTVAQRSATIPFDVENLSGELAVSTQHEGGVTRVTLEVRNRTQARTDAGRSEALRDAFVSAHVLLEAHGGEFASLLDPPQAARAMAATCKNERVFPVLAGEEAPQAQTSSALLISPIILYDFPRVASASPTHTFDGTEIDELLMLTVASLTDEEKREARGAHPHVRELVERAEALDADTLRMLHGEITGGAGTPGGESVLIDGVTVQRGSRVRVQPKGRADVWDDLVRGMTARVNAVHTDFDGKRYVGVVFDADPASDLHEWYGRSFFYGADELEPIV